MKKTLRKTRPTNFFNLRNAKFKKGLVEEKKLTKELLEKMKKCPCIYGTDF